MKQTGTKPNTLLLIASGFLLAASSLMAQEKPGPPNELDKIYVPGKNSLFNTDNKTGTSNDYSVLDIKNNIKFNPALLVRGTAGFFYERSFNDQISFQAGFGSCFNRDFVAAVGGEFGDALFSSPVSSVNYYTILNKGRFSGPGLFLSGGFRFHWDTYYASDWRPYFEVNGRFSSGKYGMTTASINTNPSYGGDQISGSPKVTVKNAGFNLIYGLQFTTSGSVKTVHDFYIGAGIRNASYNIFNGTSNYNGGNSYTLHTMSSSRESIVAPTVIAGYAFGIGF